jgi:hypothetical protein
MKYPATMFTFATFPSRRRRFDKRCEDVRA